LSALFVSSCYWQPFPVDNQLVLPWSENITTFSQALNASVSNLTLPQPAVIRVVDRCWCDFASGNFFEPYNVSQWERASVQKLKEDLELQQKIQESQEMELRNAEAESKKPPQTTITMPKTPTSRGTPRGILDVIRSIYYDTHAASTPLPASTPVVSDVEEPKKSSASSSEPREPLPLLRKEYDLRPYGMDMVVDFGWSHS
jgi:hypothetical protein